MPALSLFAIFAAAVVFVRAFFRHDGAAGNNRLAPPQREFSAAGRVYCFIAALAVAGVKADFARADHYVAKGLSALLA